MDLCNVNEIKALLGRHGFRFSKSMGQNFLIEERVPRDIAAASGADRDCGAERAGRVVSVELDKALLPVLAETLAGRDNVEIVPGDIMKLDIPALIAEKMGGLKPLACANLPYNITTPVLTALIEAGCFQAITVMIQREVALRICAAPGSGDYGAFSVYCQYHTVPELLFDVPPECFIPAPKVTSSVIRLVPRPAPEEVKDEKQFFRLVRAAFAQRRKTLLNALSSAYGSQLTKDALRDAIAACGLPADVRGERLGIPEFAALADALAQRTEDERTL